MTKLKNIFLINKTNIRLSIPLVLVTIITLLLSGCMPSGIKTKGMVAWNYNSKIKVAQTNEKIPISLRVVDFESNKPKCGFTFGTFIGLFPIVSFFVPSHIYVNSIHKDSLMDCVDLKDDEVENILVEELNKSDMVNDVVFGGEIKDFEIRGKVNFEHRLRDHKSGFGIFYLAVLPMLTVPQFTLYDSCTAHFEVVSSKDNRVIFSKDYFVEEKSQTWLAYNYDNVWKRMGNKIFPKIVEEFITDLKSLPQSKWRKSKTKP